jgi:hypothetical protein
MPIHPGSRKGIANAPLFLVFAGVVLMITTLIAMHTMEKWGESDGMERTINEAKRISQTCESIKFAGDQGTIQELHVEIPKKCSITIGSSLIASCSFSNVKRAEIPTKAKITGSPSIIQAGSNTVRIVYSSNTPAAVAGAYVIYVT